MKFRLLLWALGLMMKKASKKNPGFQKQLVGKDFIFQIKTQDDKIARHFTVKNDKVKAKGGTHADAAFTISFKDADTGLSIMTAKDKNAFMKGIQDKTIIIDGDYSLLIWFQMATTYLKPGKKKKK